VPLRDLRGAETGARRPDFDGLTIGLRWATVLFVLAKFASLASATVVDGYGGVRLDLNNTVLACFILVDLDRPNARIEEPLFLREKELRIALVCFGGVSLAVYMHGVCKEILKLVRASSALHRITDRSRRAKAAFFDQADASDPEYDTESDYFDLLQEIGHKIELRVIVDILAGASAGGINATMLARALSHDLPILRQRDLWLDNADVTVLLAPEARAGTWSKWILKPLIWGAAATGLFDAVRDNEVRRKLSLFLRSRWFKPPFYGLGMAGLGQLQ
jgi:Patatin-like phospholipase